MTRMENESKELKDSKTELLGLFDNALSALKSGQKLEGKDGALTPLIKRLIEASMEGEMEIHLEKSRPNRRNGKGSKKVKTSFGAIDIATPRDRDASYTPELLAKRQRKLGPSLEQKIISLYSMGMSYRDISSHILEMYDMELSPSQLTTITDKVWPEIEEWRTRVLDDVYPFVWLDALYYKVRQDGQIRKMAAYLVLGMNLEGEKDLLGIYLSETESSSFWLQVLSDLRDRGVKDILIASIDNLPGFKEAIEMIFPATDVQLCIVHQIRNSLRYVRSTEERELIADLKTVYRAHNIEEAERALDSFEEKWGRRYPAVIKSWRTNWSSLSSFYAYPQEIRKIMYTTNSIEGFNRQMRKATKTKGALPSERALLKMLYLVSKNVKKKWGTPRSWKAVIGILQIKYYDRIQQSMPY